MLKFIKILIWLILIFGGLFWWKYQSFSKQEVCIDFVGNDGYFRVEKGESFQSVLTRIFDAGLLVRLYLKQFPPSFELQAGKYEVICGNISEITESLKQPMNETDENITFLEGWNIYDIDKTLTSEGLIKAGAFVDFVTNCESFCPLKASYAFISDIETLEGFLYPDTYAVNPNSFTIENLVRKMLSNFQVKVIDSEILANMGSIEILDIINMASIVQKEVTFQGKSNAEIYEEASTVAGILLKRAREGWYIGADATVCYAHKLPTQDCTPREVLKYLYDKNEYNTRQMIGMPRGPIANPEARIIAAVMKPTESPYYYYLHAPNGQIYYGRTNAEHEENKRKYLR